MAESKIIVFLSFEWTSKAAAVSLRATSASCHPLWQLPEQSYLFCRVSYGSLLVWLLSHLVSAELLSLHVVHAKLNSQHIFKTTACIWLPQSTRAAGKPPSSCCSVTPKHLLTCRPFLGALLFGVRGVSQPSICYLLLDNCWAQKNWNILKKKQGKKKSIWRNWIINSCSRNASLVETARSSSSGAPGCDLKGPVTTSESVVASFFNSLRISGK